MPKKKNIGVSMVEILISITIFAVLMIPIVKGIITSMNNTVTAKALQNRNELAANIMEYIKTDSVEDIMSGKYLTSLGSTDFDKKAYFYINDNGLASEAAKINALDPELATLYKKMKKKDPSSTAIKSSNAKLVTSIEEEDGSTTDITTIKPYEEYEVSGKIKIGTKSETYTYKAAISNEYYANKALNGYTDPNSLAMGIVEDIDHNKIALFNGTIANYDTTVSNAFLTKKIEILKSVDPDWYDIYYNQVKSPNIFPNDTATRKIIIKVSGSYKRGYTVSCTLEYRDNSETRSEVKRQLDAEDYKISYTPFTYNYPAGEDLPNIYLMYNCCLYNNRYSKDDYIVFDTSELDKDYASEGSTELIDVNETSDEAHVTNVRCFIIQTAEKFSSKLVESNEDSRFTDDDGNVEVGLNESQIMYNSNVIRGNILRSDVRIHMVATKASKLNHLSVYYNFDIPTDDYKQDIDASKETERNSRLSASDYNNKKSKNVYYTDKNNNIWSSGLASGQYKPLIAYTVDPGTGDAVVDKQQSLADFKPLDYANEESRGLYEVRLWVVKGDVDPDTIETNKKNDDGTDNANYSDPILTATKGGNEN